MELHNLLLLVLVLQARVIMVVRVILFGHLQLIAQQVAVVVLEVLELQLLKPQAVTAAQVQLTLEQHMQVAVVVALTHQLVVVLQLLVAVTAATLQTQVLQQQQIQVAVVVVLEKVGQTMLTFLVVLVVQVL